MKRSFAISSALLLAGLTGCMDLDMPTGRIQNKAVEVPTQSDASLATAARVDLIGRQLVAQSPFLGVEPTFHTFGRNEPEIYHPDSNGVFITEGLVAKCKTDDELAAVLATELGKMAVEKRNSERMKLVNPNAILADAGARAPGEDPTQLAVQAVFDKQIPRAETGKSKGTSDDPKAVAGEILQSAGFKMKSLETVAPLLEESNRTNALAEQFRGRSAKATWSK